MVVITHRSSVHLECFLVWVYRCHSISSSFLVSSLSTEAHSSDVPEDANEEGENESVIYGLEVELKNNKGKYS